MKLLEELSKDRKDLTANEVQDRAKELDLIVEKGAIYYASKELGIQLKQEKRSGPRNSKLTDLEAKLELLDAELQQVKDALKKLYLEGFGFPYPEDKGTPESPSDRNEKGE
jgi:hypothetical protein